MHSTAHGRWPAEILPPPAGAARRRQSARRDGARVILACTDPHAASVRGTEASALFYLLADRGLLCVVVVALVTTGYSVRGESNFRDFL